MSVQREVSSVEINLSKRCFLNSSSVLLQSDGSIFPLYGYSQMYNSKEYASFVFGK